MFSADDGDLGERGQVHGGDGDYTISTLDSQTQITLTATAGTQTGVRQVKDALDRAGK